MTMLLSASLLAGAGCSPSKPAGQPAALEGNTAATPDRDEPTPVPTINPQERAVRAKDALFQRLSSELVAAMSSGGPAKAIEACSRLAPKIAREVGEQHQVRIGRTSLRLRNPRNTAPEWAVSYLNERPEKAIFTTLDDGRSAAIFPIHLKVQCLTCHGPREGIAADIMAELQRLYPDDQATGFQEGDLRGWFWVEVPATQG